MTEPALDAPFDPIGLAVELAGERYRAARLRALLWLVATLLATVPLEHTVRQLRASPTSFDFGGWALRSRPCGGWLRATEDQPIVGDQRKIRSTRHIHYERVAVWLDDITVERRRFWTTGQSREVVYESRSVRLAIVLIGVGFGWGWIALGPRGPRLDAAPRRGPVELAVAVGSAAALIALWRAFP